MPSANSVSDLVCEIADGAFQDGLEIIQLLNIIEAQNVGGVNAAIGLAGGARAANANKNALISRVVLLVDRTYAPSRDGDLHLGRAFELLKEETVKREIEARGSLELLADAVTRWQRLNADNNRRLIKHFRDKFTAHLGVPDDDIPLPTFKELFDFARATTGLMDVFARATGQRSEGLDAWSEELEGSATAFWKPWSDIH